MRTKQQLIRQENQLEQSQYRRITVSVAVAIVTGAAIAGIMRESFAAASIAAVTVSSIWILARVFYARRKARKPTR